MDLRLLGPLEVRFEDGLVELGPRQQRAVFAMLALEPGQTVSADRLAEGLWAEAPPASAPKMVQLYVSRLRRLLDGSGVRIVTRGRGYELQLPEEESVDAIRFERLLDTRPRDALALWRGQALSDLADEPFAATEIRRLEELRLRATELAIDADLAAGRHAEVIAELEALVAQEPLRERLHARLMLALYRSGRQADALEAYRHAREVLVEQLGIEPGPELHDVQQAILDQDPALDAPVMAGERPTERPSLPDPPTALIGRASELEDIAGQLCDRGTRLLTLLGPGGVGKTRLALAAAASVEGRFADGASFVSLAPLADPAELAAAIAVTFGVPVQGRAAPTEALLQFLTGKEALLCWTTSSTCSRGRPCRRICSRAAPG